MKLQSDNGKGLWKAAGGDDPDGDVLGENEDGHDPVGALDVPLEDFHGVPHAGEDPHDALLPHAFEVGMKPTGGAGYVPAPAPAKGD